MEKLAGVPAAEIIGKHPSEVLPSLQAESIMEHLEQTLAGKICAPLEFYFQSSKTGHSGWTISTFSPLRDSRGQIVGVISIVRDLTESRAIMQALRSSEERYRGLAESLPDAVYILDSQSVYQYLNETGASWMGFPASEIIGKKRSEFFPVETIRQQQIVLNQVRETGQSAIIEWKVPFPSGERWVETRLIPLGAATGRRELVIAISRDLTDQKQLQQQVLEISAEERQRIGYDLHDGLGQHLSGIAFMTKSLENELLTISPAHAGEVGKIVTLLNEAIMQTRSLARILAPVDVEASGLSAALANLADETRKLFHIEAYFLSSLYELRFNSQVGMVFYRVAQEAIHNAMRHGAADRIDLKLYQDEHEVCLSIRDNGRGCAKDLKPQIGSHVVTANGLSLSGLDATNYVLAATNASTTASITPVTVTVTADAQVRGYGQTNPVLTASFSGFVNNEDTNVLSGYPLLATAADTNSPVGSYVITNSPGDLIADNYTFNFVNGSLTVTSAVLTVTADNQFRVYGVTNPVLTASFSGFVNNEDTNVLSGYPLLTTAADTNSPIGSYVITAAQSGDLVATNYSLLFSNGTLQVAVAALTPSITAQGKIYDGTTNVTLISSNLAGVLPGDDVTLQVGSVGFADKNADIDPKTVTATLLTLGGAQATNYFLNTNLVITTASITQRALNITAAAADRVYDGDVDVSVTFSDDRVLNDVFDINYSASFDNWNSGSENVTVSGITLSGMDSGNYTTSDTVSTSATISPAAITVSATSDEKPYDGVTSSFGQPQLVSGTLYELDSLGFFTQTFDTPTAGTSKTLTASGVVDDGNDGNNYAVTLQTATGIIDRVPLIITANDDSKTYDGQAYTGGAGVQYDGFIPGEDQSNLGSNLSYSGDAIGAIAAGTYPIQPGGYTSQNYAIDFESGTLTVNQSTVTVTADPQTKIYGAADPTLTYNVSPALAAGDSFSGTLSRDPGESVASYNINQNDLSLSDNYELIFNPGSTLTITPANLSITASNITKAYGQTVTFNETEFSSSGLTNNDSISTVTLVSDGATNTAIVGTYPIVPSAPVGIDTNNYSIAYNNGTLTVTSAVLTVTADDKERAYGVTNPVLTANYSGFVNNEDTNVLGGAPELVCAADTNSPIGSYVITNLPGTLTNLTDNNYSFVFSNGTLTVKLAALTPSIAASDKVYNGTTNVTLTSSNLVGVLPGDDVTLQVGSVGFADKNAAPDKTVTATQLTLGGAQGTNYFLTTNLVTTTASITQKELMVVSAAVTTKVYDGLTTAAITGATLSGVVGSDDVVLGNAANGTFGDPNVNTGIAVSTAMNLSGNESTNYSLTQPVLTGDITRAPLGITANNVSKNFDSLSYTGGNGVTYSGFVNSETPAVLGGTLVYDGTSQGALNEGIYSIIPSGLTSGNYAINYTNGTLTVSAVAPTVVSLSPVNQTNNATTTASFAVSVVGSSSYTNFQWIKITPTTTNVLADGGNIFGSTSNVLTITNVLAADQAKYVVSVSNPAGTVTTNGTLVVIDPFIFGQPINVTNSLGGNIAFNVTAAGTAPLHYQWQQNNVSLPGQNASNLVLTGIADSAAGNYRVIITNPAGLTISSNATLVITHPPVFTLQPISLVVTQGSTAQFTVNVNGTSPFTYQWKKNGVNLANGGNIFGATSRTLIFNAVTASDAANSYTVFVANADGNNTSSSVSLTVIVPPTITGQPQGLTNNAGQVVSFAVTNSGSPAVYRWYKNGSTLLSDNLYISGSSTSTLTISNILGADSANYTVTISNAAALVASIPATLKVIDPIITSQPVSRTNDLGTFTSFTVVAYGTAPQYQWLKNGNAILGANAATYSIVHVADTDAATYAVIVSNAFGSVTSATPATLTVIDPPVIIAGPVSRTNNAGTAATFSVNASGTALAYQWLKDAAPLSDVGNISGAQTATLTLANVQDSDRAGYSVVVSNVLDVVTSAPLATLTVIDSPVITIPPANLTINATSNATFTVSYTGTSPSFQWYTNGIVLSGATSATLTLNNVSQANAADYTVALSNAAGSVTSAPPAHLTVIDAPVITSAPQGVTNNAHSTVVFTVSYTGTSPNFQWFTNGAVLSGATSATLTLNNVSQANAMNYTVVLSNVAGSVTSSPPAHLTVIDAPVITSQPLSQTNNAGTTASFTVTNIGSPSDYRWYKNGVNLLNDGGNISGATTPVLTISNVLGADGAVYDVVISNAASVVTSSGATLTVVDPFITLQPTGVTNITGSTVSFAVTAVGTTPLHYQWYQDGGLLFYETNSSLSIFDIAGGDAGSYTVVITNVYGAVTSTPALLVTVPPLIVTQPASQTVNQGQTVSFNVDVNGQTPFSYQWSKDGADLPGEVNRILSFASVQASDAGIYQVHVINPLGDQYSESAKLTVVVPPTITAQPVSLTNNAGTTAVFAVTNAGSPSAYQWYKGIAPIAGANTAILTLTNVQQVDAANRSARNEEKSA